MRFFILLQSFSVFLISEAFQVAPATYTRNRSIVVAQSESSEDTLNPSPPYRISIEYCTGCRWMLKSFWMAQELLTTFEEDLDAVTIVPSSTKGIFSVCLNGSDLLWDRKEQGGFPSPKGLKQIIRDMVQPEKFLGHSDTEDRQKKMSNEILSEKTETTLGDAAGSSVSIDTFEEKEPAVTISYCTGCRWLLRGAYFGQEILTTFGDEIKSVSLVPSKPPEKGGRFTIELNGELLFDRAEEGRFPEVKEIKQMIRDKIVPEKDLGHSDIQEVQKIISDQIEKTDEEMDDDEAAEQRKFFGVL